MFSRTDKPCCNWNGNSGADGGSSISGGGGSIGSGGGKSSTGLIYK